MTELKHRPGKNPASLKNLDIGKSHSQNYATRVASKFNWDKRVIGAAWASLVHHNAVTYAVASLEFYKLTPERQRAIRELDKHYKILMSQMQHTMSLISKIKDTPLRTPEAHQERLRARRIARHRREAAKSSS